MQLIKPSIGQLNEGESLTTSLSGFTPGTTLFYKVVGRGVSKKDFAAGAVKGSLKVDANGVASIAHTLKADKKTEGAESFTIQVFSDKKMRNLVGESDAVAIADTSVKAAKGSGGGSGSNSGNSGTDPITGNWSTQDGITLTFTITSNNTASRKYFAIADMDSFNGSHPVNYRGFADTNSNGVFDAGVDIYTATASVASWDGIPRYSGTFRAESGKLLNLDGPANSFGIPQDFFG